MVQGGALSMTELLKRMLDEATSKLQGLERQLCAHHNALAFHHLEACQATLDADTRFSTAAQGVPELPGQPAADRGAGKASAGAGADAAAEAAAGKGAAQGGAVAEEAARQLQSSNAGSPGTSQWTAATGADSGALGETLQAPLSSLASKHQDVESDTDSLWQSRQAVKPGAALQAASIVPAVLASLNPLAAVEGVGEPAEPTTPGCSAGRPADQLAEPVTPGRTAVQPAEVGSKDVTLHAELAHIARWSALPAFAAGDRLAWGLCHMNELMSAFR